MGIQDFEGQKQTEFISTLILSISGVRPSSSPMLMHTRALQELRQRHVHFPPTPYIHLKADVLGIHSSSPSSPGT